MEQVNYLLKCHDQSGSNVNVDLSSIACVVV